MWLILLFFKIRSYFVDQSSLELSTLLLQPLLVLGFQVCISTGSLLLEISDLNTPMCCPIDHFELTL